MFITGFPAGAWSTNCYVLATGPGEPCVIVDPGQDSIDRVHEIIAANRLVPAAVMLTHGHMDHVWSVAPVTRDFEVPALIQVCGALVAISGLWVFFAEIPAPGAMTTESPGLIQSSSAG